jgi:predicted amidophosphoribosyltransferase
MQEDPVKVCVYCRAEYALDAQSCADCGGPLEFPGGDSPRATPIEEGDAVVLVRQGAVNYLRELEQLLTRAGMPSGIRFHGSPPGT